MDLKSIFDKAVQENLDKDATLMKMVQAGASITEAVTEYTRLAKEAGIIKTFEQRMEWLEEHLNEDVVVDPTARKAFTEGYAKQLDISVATAQSDIRNWAVREGVTIVSASRHSLEELVKFVDRMLKEDASRQEILNALQDQMNYTESSAVGAYSRALKELGITPAGSGPKVPIDQLVYLIRSHEHLGPKDLVKKIMDTYGYEKSTASSFLSYLKFAKEHTRQEMLAANSKEAA